MNTQLSVTCYFFSYISSVFNSLKKIQGDNLQQEVVRVAARLNGPLPLMTTGKTQ